MPTEEEYIGTHILEPLEDRIRDEIRAETHPSPANYREPLRHLIITGVVIIRD